MDYRRADFTQLLGNSSWDVIVTRQLKRRQGQIQTQSLKRHDADNSQHQHTAITVVKISD